ncbi:MAG TPA: aminotransferase class I/II-fold pyridoxal phosphate-dependent enzyme [Candidatus Eremiobacteraceae bacterium]
MNSNPFEDLSLDRLRLRTSKKWAFYPPDILPAFVAETDFPLAPAVRAALDSALDSGDCGYAEPRGFGAVFAAFANARFGWPVDADRVFVVPDVMAGVIESIRAFSPPASAVVINPPVYPPFFETLAHDRRPIVEVPLLQDAQSGRWSLDFSGLEKAFAEGVGAYLLCSPHNPVGRVWPEADLRRLAALAERYHVLVVVDEIHAPLTMPGATFVPYLTVSGYRQNAVAVTSTSKAWNIPGLKCALVVAGSEPTADRLRAHLTALETEIIDRTGQLGIVASLAAFRDGPEWLDALVKHLDSNRQLLAELLSKQIPGARYLAPEATYLAWIDCSTLGIGTDPAAYFLERGRVALARGLDFGKQCSSFARLNFGTSSAILTEIVERMARSL